MTKDLEVRVTNLENRVSALENTSHVSFPESGGKKRNPSVNEFLREKGVTRKTSVVNLVLAIAVYNERFRNTGPFSRNDLRELIRKAKQKEPTNINDCINRNIHKGYIEIEEDEVGEDGTMRWHVTSSGYEFVDNNLNNNEQNS